MGIFGDICQITLIGTVTDGATVGTGCVMAMETPGADGSRDWRHDFPKR